MDEEGDREVNRDEQIVEEVTEQVISELGHALQEMNS